MHKCFREVRIKTAFLPLGLLCCCLSVSNYCQVVLKFHGYSLLLTCTELLLPLLLLVQRGSSRKLTAGMEVLCCTELEALFLVLPCYLVCQSAQVTATRQVIK